MGSIQEGPLNNAIQEGIKEDIEVALANNRLRAAVMLIYAGMDAMAFLDMPASQEDVNKKDFILWANRYLRFPCKEQITGEDFYGARCALLHSYRVDSRMSRQGKCRMVGYLDKALPPEVRYAPQISTELVLVSIAGLKRAFFEGVNKFLIDAYTNKEKAITVEARLQNMIQQFPGPGQTPTNDVRVETTVEAEGELPPKDLR
jgi:hypothetical protein